METKVDIPRAETTIEQQTKRPEGAEIFKKVCNIVIAGIGSLALGGSAQANATEVATLTSPTEVHMTAVSKSQVSKNFDIEKIINRRVKVAVATPIPKNNSPGHRPYACAWRDGWNFYTVGGVKHKMWDKHMWVCKDKDSPTGYVKRGGGKTGRDCENVVIPNKPISKLPTKVRRMPVLRGKFVEVQSLGTKFKLQTKAEARVSCSTEVAQASARAMAVAKQYVSLKTVLRNRLDFQRMMNANYNLQTRFGIRVRDAMMATAVAKVSCKDILPPAVDKNAKPIVDLVGLQHSIVNRTDRLCANFDDPDGKSDVAKVIFSESGAGNIVSYPYKVNDQFCVDFATGVNPGTAVVSAVAVDSKGLQSDKDTESWPVVADPFFQG